MTTILSFDTSADFCAAALVRAETALACDSLPMSRGHAEALVPLVQELCAEAGIKLSGVDLIGVTVGPGSFTGVPVRFRPSVPSLDFTSDLALYIQRFHY